MRRRRKKRGGHKSSSTKPIAICFIIIAVLLFSGIQSFIETVNSFIQENSSVISIVLSILLVLAIIGIAIYLIFQMLKKRYRNFVMQHSRTIIALSELNERYTFDELSHIKYESTYDNEIFYENISPEDYLTYQLVYVKKTIVEAINSAEHNSALYKEYIDELDRISETKGYNTEKLPLFKFLLNKIERDVYNEMLLKPDVEFVVKVELFLTNINGKMLTSKIQSFCAKEVLAILEKMDKKRGDFYLDDEIWQSICRVERGKVTNKIRFAIYARDNYRCCKCGASGNDLEIDHIYPIAKGGKSNFDNLQTLCHRCNSLKSDSIEPGAEPPKRRNNSH